VTELLGPRFSDSGGGLCVAGERKEKWEEKPAKGNARASIRTERHAPRAIH